MMSSSFTRSLFKQTLRGRVSDSRPRTIFRARSGRRRAGAPTPYPGRPAGEADGRNAPSSAASASRTAAARYRNSRRKPEGVRRQSALIGIGTRARDDVSSEGAALGRPPAIVTESSTWARLLGHRRLLIPYLQKGGHAGCASPTSGKRHSACSRRSDRTWPRASSPSSRTRAPSSIRRRGDSTLRSPIPSCLTQAPTCSRRRRETAALLAPQGVLIAPVVEGNDVGGRSPRLGVSLPTSTHQSTCRAMAAASGLRAVRLAASRRWWLFARDMERAHAASGELSWNAGAQRDPGARAPRLFRVRSWRGDPQDIFRGSGGPCVILWACVCVCPACAPFVRRAGK